MTHVFPGEILTHMKQQGMRVPASILIATDYTCIPFAEEVVADAYVIPSADLKEEFFKRGVPAEKIYPYGIPVAHSFTCAEDRRAARKKLGLDDEKHYMLIAGGSMGAGKIVDVLRLLEAHYQQDSSIHYIVLCGRNQRIYKQLEERYIGRATLIMHTDCMADYLKACDLFLTKPGGLSTTEAAVVGTPLIHLKPIPGCETRNATYFCSHGMSVFVRSLQSELIQAVEQLNSHETVAEMLLAQQREINRYSSSDICDLAETMIQTNPTVRQG